MQTAPKKEDIGEAVASISSDGVLPEEGQEGEVMASTVLSAWMGVQVQSLIAQLERLCLGIDDGGELRAVIEQTAYFAERMGHVGFDFISAVLPVFHGVVLSRVSLEWSRAVEDFEEMLATQRYQPDKRAGLSGAERGSMQQVVPLYAQQHQPQDVNSQRVTGALATPQKRAAGLHADEGELPPPHELSSFPPLAFLLNTILAQLSLLRECPLKTVQYDVEKELAALLHRVSEHLVKERKVLAEKGARYLDKRQETEGTCEKNDDEVQVPMDIMYARAFAFHLAPHALACLDCIFREGVPKAFKVSSPVADPSRRDTGGGNMSVGGETVSVKPEKAKYKAMHVERLLDAQTALSPERAMPACKAHGLCLALRV